MTRSILIAMALLTLTGCGVRRPLMKPKDIPAYEENMRRKREQLYEEEKNAQDAARAQQGQQ